MSKFLDEDSFSNVKGVAGLDLKGMWENEQTRKKIIIGAVAFLVVVVIIIVLAVVLTRGDDDNKDKDKDKNKETTGDETKAFGGMLPRHKVYLDPIGSYSTSNVDRLTNTTLAATAAGFRDDRGDLVSRGTHRSSNPSSFRSTSRSRKAKKMTPSAGRRTDTLYDPINEEGII